MATDEDFAWAVKTGDLSRVKEFVEKEKKNVNMVEKSVTKQTPMHWAADFNQLEVMKYLVSKGANINAKDAFGGSPLLASVYEGHADIVEFLLSKKADVNVKGPDGKTAKQAAQDKPEIAALFK